MNSGSAAEFFLKAARRVSVGWVPVEPEEPRLSWTRDVRVVKSVIAAALTVG